MVKRRCCSFYNDSDLVNSKAGVPLQVLMEGRSWGLTSLLITSTALWMVILEKEDDNARKFFGLYSYFANGLSWQEELLEYLFYSVIAVVSACVCFGALHINLRPPGVTSIRLKLLTSSLALAFFNLISLMMLFDAVTQYLWNRGNWQLNCAHNFVSLFLFLCVIMSDIVFVKYFGCCLCLSCSEFDPLLKTRDLREPIYRINDTIEENIGLNEANFKNRGLTHDPPKLEDDIENEVSSMPEEENCRVAIKDEHRTSEISEIFINEIEEEEMEINDDGEGFLEESDMNEDSEVKLKEESEYDDTINSSTDTGATSLAKRKPKRWDTKKMLKTYKTTMHTLPDKHVSIQDHSQPLVTAESNLEDEARPEDLTWIVTSLRNPKNLVKKVIDAVKEEENFKYSVWIKSAALTTAVLLIYTALRTMIIFDGACLRWITGLSKTQAYIKAFQAFLTEQQMLSESDTNYMDNLVNYLTAIIPVLRITAYVGYPIGLTIAFHSLYSVIVQHKRLSRAMNFELLAHEHEFSANANESTERVVLVRDMWPDLEKRYPIGESVYFLGVLTSTGVIQFQIFGFVLSFIFAVLFDIKNYEALMKIFGYYVLIYIIIVIIDYLVLHIIPDKILSSGFKIRHPRVFFFYMLTFSMVHLVLGYLYALWRIVYLLVVTLFILNRMDICLTREFKKLDSGHRAFMSMLVLTRIVQMEKHEKDKNWLSIKKAINLIKKSMRITEGKMKLRYKKTPTS